jgi:16S rRNA (adenine1518-N6/adenine1519-N6)-dimethyltransferase
MTAPRTLLSAWQLRAKKKLGQNFLKNPAIIDEIIAESNLTAKDTVLEIGAGLGALTLPLGRVIQNVIALEIDKQIIPLLHNEINAANLKNISIIETNALKCDFEELIPLDARPVIVMGNLPYQISSQILIKLIQNRVMISRAVLMFQKELAERLMASPGCKSYGRLSVMLQYCAEVRHMIAVKPENFFPRPKVDSTIIEIRFLTDPPFPTQNEAFLHQTIKAAFGRRRKTLRNAIKGSQLEVSPEVLEKAFEESGIDPIRRAETLSVEEFVRLSDTLADKLNIED